MTFDANMFNFDAMKEAVGANPFEEKANKGGRDERFYNLAKDKDGNGAAIIRFLPDSEKGMIQRLYSINTTIVKNGKKRFVSEYSPATIGLPCPFQEKWQELWNADQKEEAKTFGRGIRYVSNIKVIKDPANPENEGKIFLYAMSGKMKDKIQAAVDPSEQDRALGAEPKQMFNPFKGNSFRLVAKKGANGQINYDSSEVISEVTSIYDSIEEGLEDLKANTHKLSSLVEPESFMSYEELTEKLNWVQFIDSAPKEAKPLTAEVAQPTEQVSEVTEVSQVTDEVSQPTETVIEEPKPASKADDLDSLLSGLV